jgi:putative FmdB family regulatory protein
MPLYEYECAKCGEKIEVIRSFADPPLTVCPNCGGALKKLLSSPAFQFKGSGFYLTDYGKSGSAGDRAGEKSEERKEKEKSSSKGEEGGASSASSSGEAGGSGEKKKKDDSSKGKRGGDAGAAPPAPSAGSSPAPSKKSPKGDTK